MEDRETGKVVQKPRLFMRQSRSVQLDSRSVCTRATKLRDKIVDVTLVLGVILT